MDGNVEAVAYQIAELITSYQFEFEFRVGFKKLPEPYSFKEMCKCAMYLHAQSARTSARPSITDATASSRPVSSGPICPYNRRPSSVMETERVVRSNNRIPRRASSRAMDRLTPDCDIFNALPAPAKLPHCTIAARMLIPFRIRSSKF
jgi:hypothetical protein